MQGAFLSLREVSDKQLPQRSRFLVRPVVLLGERSMSRVGRGEVGEWGADS